MPGTQQLLNELGLTSIDELFSDIPKTARSNLRMANGISETEILSLFKVQASKNIPSVGTPSFLGGDIQPRYIPAPLKYILSRGELLTAYTSYQPEISQGMLQALFEYQSLMSELTGMDVVNASLYDAATGLGEALRLSTRINRKKTFLLPDILCPAKKNVARTYIEGYGGVIKFYNTDRETGMLDMNNLSSMVDAETSAIYVEMPNPVGVLDKNIFDIKEMIPNTLLIAGVDPVSLAVLREPGSYGADIVIGEGQGLGLPMGFGGPTLGILGVKKEHVRKIPGRLVGATHDSKGNRGFCITLQTREQHIRREKATSNICSNEALCALGAGAYIALLGESGLKRLASLLTERAHSLALAISEIDGFQAPFFQAPFFNSFAVETSCEYKRVEEHLLEQGIQAGSPLANIVPEGEKLGLFSVNETIPEEAYGALIKVLHEIEGWGC